MAKYLGGEFIEEAEKEIRGSRENVRSFERKGFKIVERDGDLWVLKRPAKMIIVLEHNGAVYSFDMIENVRKMYGKSKISSRLAYAFQQALKAGEVQIELHPDDHSYELKKCS